MTVSIGWWMPDMTQFNLDAKNSDTAYLAFVSNESSLCWAVIKTVTIYN